MRDVTKEYFDIIHHLNIIIKLNTGNGKFTSPFLDKASRLLNFEKQLENGEIKIIRE